MNREEKKKWLETKKDYLHISFSCIGVATCATCPFRSDKGICTMTTNKNESLLNEVWTEANGYIKKPEIISIVPDKVLSLNDLPDPINPDHYKAGKMQIIEQMMVLFGVEQTANFCKLNAYKYQGRAGLKGEAVLDHKKADWYMRLYNQISGCTSNYTGMKLLKEFLEEEENDG